MGLRMLPYALLLTVAGLFSSALSASLVYDPVATAELEEAIKKDEFVVLVKGARGGKAGSGLLLELKFPGEMRHFSLMQKDDTVSVLHGGESVSWTVPRGAPLSLVWAQGSEEEERESSLRMYRACSPLEQLKTRSSPRDVFSSMEVPSVKLYRDKHVTVNILTGALSEVLGCPESGWTPPLSRAHEKSRKHRKPPGASSREEEADMMAHQPYDDNDVPYTRGDIPIIHTDNCDDLLVKTINELIKQIQMLKQEVERQRGEVGQLRRTLENCAGCREPPRVTCASRPGPCYPGE